MYGFYIDFKATIFTSSKNKKNIQKKMNLGKEANLVFIQKKIVLAFILPVVFIPYCL